MLLSNTHASHRPKFYMTRICAVVRLPCHAFRKRKKCSELCFFVEMFLRNDVLTVPQEKIWRQLSNYSKLLILVRNWMKSRKALYMTKQLTELKWWRGTGSHTSCSRVHERPCINMATFWNTLPSSLDHFKNFYIQFYRLCKRDKYENKRSILFPYKYSHFLQGFLEYFCFFKRQ